METALLVKCVNFAALKHRDQRRKNSEQSPYINHPIGVAYILTEIGKVDDSATIQAALLHDTVEDTDTSFEEIEKMFGVLVCSIVKEVTDDKTLPKMERKRLQIEHARGASKQAKLVKLADKLHNLRDLTMLPPVGWEESRIQEYFEWSAKVVKGLRGTNRAIEHELDAIFRSKNVYDFSI